MYEGLDIKIIRPTTLTINEFDKLLEINKAVNKKSLIRRVGA